MLENYKITDIDSPKEIQEKHTKLADFLNKCSSAYYADELPLITDSEYDELMRYLQEIESKYSLSSDVSSKVGSSLSKKKSKGFATIKHSRQMMSLDNVFSLEELQKFDEKIKRFLNMAEDTQIKYFSELKVDGLSLSLRYENGILTQALTRGDGEFGEDVLLNAKTIKDIPQTLHGKFPQILEVRGEVYIEKNDFLKLNQTLKDDGKKTFANPRNLASGSLRQLDYTITKSRPLKFLAWGFGEISSDYTIKDFSDIYTTLKEIGFKVNDYNQHCTGINELYKHYQRIEELRADLPFDIDGMVYKVDSIELQERLGNLVRSPRWAVAHKFKASTAITHIESITVQVGRTGVLTPVAELAPVNVGGVMVSRATLHNFDEINRKDIRVGDSVVIERAGDVIPRVLAVLLDKRKPTAAPFSTPAVCPVCGSPLEQDEGGVAIRCSGGSFYCNAMLIEGLSHFVSRSAFDIEGLGEKQIIAFNELGILSQPHNIFELKNHRDTLINLDGFGEKSVNNLLSAIESRRDINLNNFIYALGIRQIGEKLSKVLAKNFKSLDNLIAVFQNDASVININGLGASILNDLVKYFSSNQNMEVLNKLRQYVHVKDYIESEINNSSPLFEKNILFTGSLAKLSRGEAKALAERMGAIVVSSVSKKLDYLVAGSDPGSKLKKSMELEIKILSEEEFLDIVASIS
ncbi:MAG: NAD-dependent DNA ligase LigA [Alphaproteobacteria bacterium]|nr:NAD-dependent DNA ligase LigA [Alphaproteobacteria bacterium]